MDLVHDDSTSILGEEDRISNLPDEIIHRILSFLDMKYVVQTCALSKTWKNIWISLPYLNINTYLFPDPLHFYKFVDHALSHRNNHKNVSTVELKFTQGYNVRRIVDFQPSSCRNLDFQWYAVCVCTPQLSNLTIIDVTAFPEVFEVVASKLENLTASISTRGGRSSSDFQQLSTEGFDSLDKVNLSLSNYCYGKDKKFSQLLNLFQKLGSAKSLILNVDSILTLSSRLDQISHEPCPFNNLKCLKIDTTRVKRKDRIKAVPTQVKNYLLKNSPNAIFIMDLPLVLKKRPRQQVHDDTMAKKVAKLEEKIQNQDEVISEQKVNIKILEAEKLQHEKLVSHIIKGKMSELKVQVESGNPSYEVIRSMGCDMKSVINLIPESLRLAMVAQLDLQYEEVKSRFFTCIDVSQWEKIETALGNTREPQRTRSNNTESQSDVPVAELLQALRPSTANLRFCFTLTS
ncbi:F-box domain, cyclin-like protein [Tanacetum coccineum]